MFKAIDVIINVICFTGATVGLWLLISPLVLPGLRRNIYFARTVKIYAKPERAKRSRVLRHMEMLLTVTYSADASFSLLTFTILSGALFAVIFVLSGKSGFNFLARLCVAAAAGATPYLLLRVKLHSMRVEASYEGETGITELNNQYKINYLNMVEALDRTVKNLRDCPYIKKAFKKLSYGIKQYRTEGELENIIQEFTFAVNTRWAVHLSNCIYLSIAYGDDVREAMGDIISDLKKVRRVLEKNKRYNNEAFTMIRFIVPVTYALSVFAAVKYFGFTLGKFAQLQFYTSMGLKTFILSAGTWIVNYIIYQAVKKPKYDY